MKTQSRDTHPDIERVQIELLRKAGVAERLRLAGEWGKAMMELSLRAIRGANAGATEEEIELLFVELHYGRPLADRLREYLKARKQEP